MLKGIYGGLPVGSIDEERITEVVHAFDRGAAVCFHFDCGFGQRVRHELLAYLRRRYGDIVLAECRMKKGAHIHGGMLLLIRTEDDTPELARLAERELFTSGLVSQVLLIGRKEHTENRDATVLRADNEPCERKMRARLIKDEKGLLLTVEEPA